MCISVFYHSLLTISIHSFFFFFFFNDTATTEIYTLSLHDALPIWAEHHVVALRELVAVELPIDLGGGREQHATSAFRREREHRLRCLDVGLDGADRLLHHELRAHGGREVEHDVPPGPRRRHRGPGPARPP